MKFLHTADWHVGKTLKGRSRLEEQRAVLREIVDIALRENVDAVLIAGDLYDSAAPSADQTADCTASQVPSTKEAPPSKE